jgi:hypothetical protein
MVLDKIRKILGLDKSEENQQTTPQLSIGGDFSITQQIQGSRPGVAPYPQQHYAAPQYYTQYSYTSTTPQYTPAQRSTSTRKTQSTSGSSGEEIALFCTDEKPC